MHMGFLWKVQLRLVSGNKTRSHRRLRTMGVGLAYLVAGYPLVNTVGRQTGCWVQPAILEVAHRHEGTGLLWP